ncbi:hypothetical protein [Chryseobacterium sp. BIGb0232]|uniref:hypothetical protein n=1 Tax=Chryseobacterium sp. BIGb0232 TaxID=2940598 RepID=UPI000F49CBB2|nr:hypothetical protein [Chryseobacterium sp. BIGb0232]MCS4300661.1 hypothetical protein [Chryseobacterium sp. BIGb0232]
MKKAYYYFFYKLYKIMLWTSSPFENFFSKFRASLALIALELWIIFTIRNYYHIVSNNNPKLSSNLPLYVIAILIIASNYISIDYYNNIWEKYKDEFDKLPKKKNIVGGIIVWGIILFITVNFFVSIHYLYQKFYGTIK